MPQSLVWRLAADRLADRLDDGTVVPDPKLGELIGRLRRDADAADAAALLRPDLNETFDVERADLVSFAYKAAGRFAELADGAAGPGGHWARDAAILKRLRRLAGVGKAALIAEGGLIAGLAGVLTPPPPLDGLLRQAADTIHGLVDDDIDHEAGALIADLIEDLRRAADIAEAADDDDWVPVVPIQRGGISFASPAATGGAFPWERPDYSDPVVVMRAAANMLAGSVAGLELADGSRFHPGNLPAHLHAAADALVEQRYADRFHRTRLQRQLDEVGRRLGARLRPLVDRLDGGPE